MHMGVRLTTGTWERVLFPDKKQMWEAETKVKEFKTTFNLPIERDFVSINQTRHAYFPTPIKGISRSCWRELIFTVVF